MSGSLGIVSSLCFLGFAFFVTPASIPIGVVFFSAGLGLLAIQTTYDEWDDMKALYDSKMAVEVKKWPKMM